MMNKKEIFYKDKENCNIPFTHITQDINDSSLKKIDELYGAADVLSIEYGKKHYRNIKMISIIAPLIAFFFLLYDEAEMHWLIVVCLVLILALFYLNKYAKKEKSHEKYLEYRVLAESLRVQHFISIANIKTHVSDILPWFTKTGIPWVYEVLLELPKVNVTEKKSIINCWIRDQIEYHRQSYIKSRKQKERDDKIEKIVLIITIIFYIATLIFELYMLLYSPFDSVAANWNRAALKIIIGTMSAVTIFLGNYYGKMSLSSKIEEHRRMEMLYEKAKNEILQKGETEELIVFLAREFLIENATWYAHQKKNKPSFTVE